MRPVAGIRTVGRASGARFSQTQTRAHNAHSRLLKAEDAATDAIGQVEQYAKHPKIVGLAGDLGKLRERIRAVAREARKVADGQ